MAGGQCRRAPGEAQGSWNNWQTGIRMSYTAYIIIASVHLFSLERFAKFASRTVNSARVL